MTGKTKGLLSFYESLTGCKKLIQLGPILERACVRFLQKKCRKRAKKKLKKEKNGQNI